MTPSMHRRQLAAVLATIVMCAGVLFYTYGRGLAARSVPEQLTDQQYWQLVEEMSEPNGYFRSDNLLSNENAYEHVIPALQSTLPAGGVYLGVGPEQNFTYIAALKPRLAFIVDIRRGNMNLHLLYKAFMELSRDRADFLSHLFARPRPANLDDRTSVEELLDAYELAPPSEELYRRYLQDATNHLTKDHKFALSADDLKGIEYVYNAFFKAGPDMNYSFSGFPFGGGGFRFPTYAVLMTETDGAGQHRSYLATEANYRLIADMEKRNAIVAITGDFAGPKALKSVGRYLKSHDATVTAIYTSNVEQYLFQSDSNWRKYYGNVATLPIDAKTTFIRSVSNRGGYQSGGGFTRAQTRLCSVADLLNAFNRGAITGYYDVIAMSK